MGEFVRVECSGCGHAMKAGAKFFGRRVKCPKCSDPLQVPNPGESPSQSRSSQKKKASSASSRSPSQRKPSQRKPSQRKSSQPKSSQRKPTLQKTTSKKRRKPAPSAEDPIDDDPFGFNNFDNDPLAAAVHSPETAKLRTPTRRKQKRKETERKRRPVIQYDDYDDDDYDDDGYERYKPNSSFDDGSMITGLLMIGGSLLWIVVGLAGGYLFFYPIILLAIGIGTFFKGLVG